MSRMLRLSEEEFGRINGNRLKPKRLKYGNQKTVQEGMAFDSKGEAGRFRELQLLEKTGEIWGLHRQVNYDIVVNGILIAKYVADFVYARGPEITVEDWKGGPTAKRRDWRLIKKLMKAVHGIDVQERMTQD